jgi:hypothetical protein
MTEHTHTALRAALGEYGITGPEAFQWRYGIDPRTLTASAALTLLHERDRYVYGCTRALETLRERLERGLVILAHQPSLATEERWFRLATRSIRLIAKMSLADRHAGDIFPESALGQWYDELQWPTPSPEMLARESREEST